MANLAWNNTGIPVSYRINGVNIRDEFGVEMSLPGALMPDVRQRTTRPSQTHGEIDSGGFYGTRRFSVSGRIMATTHANFMAQRDAFVSWLQLEDNVQQTALRGRTFEGMRLEIAGHQLSEPRFLIVTYAGGGTISPISTAHFKARAYDFTVNLKASYPFWITQEEEDTHRNTTDNSWIRVPKDTSKELGTAQTYPEFHLDGPIGAAACTVAHGRFGLNLRFNESTYTEGGSGITFTIPNIYGDNTSGNFANGVTLDAVASTEGEGAGEAVGVYGSPSSGSGHSVRLLLRSGELATNPNNANDNEFLNANTGTFACYFKPTLDIVDGVADDTRHRTFLQLGASGATSNALLIRLSEVSDVMTLQLRTVNIGGVVQSKTNNS